MGLAMKDAVWARGALMAMVIGLGACSPVGAALTGGAALGSAGLSDRGIGGTVTDLRQRSAISDAWWRENVEMYSRLTVDVTEGRVLVMGYLPTEEQRATAIRLAWQADGVREVINEVQVGEPPGWGDAARDRWITTQLRSRLTFDANVAAVNYSITTIAGSVFLIGIARDQGELQRVTDHARGLSGVQRVVSYVRLRSDPVPGRG